MDQISNIQRVLFSCSSLDQIDFDSIASKLTWEDQQTFLQLTALHPLLQKYPIKRTFLIHFMKKLIESIEKYSTEVNDDLYNFFCDLKNQQKDKDEEKYAYKHFMYDTTGNCVTIKESISFISNGTTGLCTWEAALYLVSFISEHKEEFRDKCLLELGSGVGFCGICVTKMCQPKEIYLSDCHAKVLEQLKENVDINEVGSRVKVKNITWGEGIDELIDNKFIPDYLLASDVIYDDTLFEPLLKTIEEIFDINQKCIFYLASTVRNEETLNKFVDIISNSVKKFKLEDQFVKKDTQFDMYLQNKSNFRLYKIYL